MLTEVSPVRVKTRGADSAAERAAAPRKGVTSNTLIVACGIVILFLFLFCLELYIRRSTVRLPTTSFHGNAFVEESSNPDSLCAG